MKSPSSRVRSRTAWAALMLPLFWTTAGWSQNLLGPPSDDRALFPNLRVSGGATLVQSAGIDSFTYLHRSGSGTNEDLYAVAFLPESDLEFKVGPSFGLALGGGMPMPDWLHLEIETGFSLNGFDFRAGGLDFQGDLWQIPVGVNATVPWRISESWEAFGGLGVGAVLGVLDLEGEPGWLQVGDDPPELVTVRGTHLTASGMAQAFAGVRYRFNPASALSLSYRFRGSTPPVWNRDFRAGSDDGDWEFDVSRLYSHTLHVMYECRW